MSSLFCGMLEWLSPITVDFAAIVRRIVVISIVPSEGTKKLPAAFLGGYEAVPIGVRVLL